jgi:hypothetical protein
MPTPTRCQHKYFDGILTALNPNAPNPYLVRPTQKGQSQKSPASSTRRIGGFKKKQTFTATQLASQGELSCWWGKYRKLLTCRPITSMRSTAPGRTRTRCESNQDAGGQIPVPNPPDVAQKATYVLPDTGHKRRSEAANLSAKSPKRAARGYRNHERYRPRLLLYTAAQQAC